jgi:hypothetical protein
LRRWGQLSDVTLTPTWLRVWSRASLEQAIGSMIVICSRVRPVDVYVRVSGVMLEAVCESPLARGVGGAQAGAERHLSSLK